MLLAAGLLIAIPLSAATTYVETKLTASDGAAGDMFGNGVSVSGDTAVIGAVFDDDSGTDSGSAYVFSPEWIVVEIDIKPGSDPNSVNCKSKEGVVPVGIFTDEDFDATTVDVTTLELEGIPVAEKHGKVHPEDLDGDGDEDAVVHLEKADVCEATENLPLKESVPVTLTGSTNEGQKFEGIDTIRIVKR